MAHRPRRFTDLLQDWSELLNEAAEAGRGRT